MIWGKTQIILLLEPDEFVRYGRNDYQFGHNFHCVADKHAGFLRRPLEWRTFVMTFALQFSNVGMNSARGLDDVSTSI
jgi:hypothetical protein